MVSFQDRKLFHLFSLEFLQSSKKKVEWHSLIWFPGRVPSAAFFLWLAVKQRLGTQDRLFQPAPWVLYHLCGTCLETHDHLYFGCATTKQIWTRILHKGNFYTPNIPWKELVSWMATHWQGNSFSTTIKKLCLAITVYQIWKERNSRFHTNSVHTTEDLFCSISEQIRLKLSTFNHVEGNHQNRINQTLWSLSNRIFGP